MWLNYRHVCWGYRMTRNNVLAENGRRVNLDKSRLNDKVSSSINPVYYMTIIRSVVLATYTM